jgi:FSR family fosmidomycin resistance protein-like MFS transporter
MSKRADQTSAFDPPGAGHADPEATAMHILMALSLAHLLNDTIQSLMPAIYPVLKDSFRLNYAQVGAITFVFQVTGSLLQPLVGYFADRRPRPYSLPVGMSVSLTGLVLLATATSFHLILLAAGLLGIGSAVFHPEASRVARMASGGRHGFAQSLFQVGGNLGSSFGPLLAAWVVVPHGRASILWFSSIALLGIFVLQRVGTWYRGHLEAHRARGTRPGHGPRVALSRGRVILALTILVLLIFSKYVYLVSLSNYYTFYLINHFGVSVQTSQYALFVFLFAVAAGTIIGGPVGDRIGRKRVIWISILGVAPFSLWLPYASLPVAIALTVVIGLILASAFSAIIVYAQELVPGNVGLIAGLFFGLAFGSAGLGAALLGVLADHQGIIYVFQVCSFLPLIGLLTGFLPEVEPGRERGK